MQRNSVTALTRGTVCTPQNSAPLRLSRPEAHVDRSFLADMEVCAPRSGVPAAEGPWCSAHVEPQASGHPACLTWPRRSGRRRVCGSGFEALSLSPAFAIVKTLRWAVCFNTAMDLRLGSGNQVVNICIKLYICLLYIF